MKRLALLLAVLGACGDDGGGNVPVIDAPPMVDAPAAKVVTVTCPTTPDATVMTTNTTTAFMPMATTISTGGIVRFVMSTMHDVAPNPIAPMSDPGTVVDFGQTKCLQFTAAGTYGIYCTTHAFAGTITVQ